MKRSSRPRRTANLFGLDFKYTITVAIAVFSLLCLSHAAAGNPVPTVVGPPVPQAVPPASGQFTLKVYGANFVQGAVVNWNRQPRKTTFISARELQAQILASDVASPTAGYITVTNPPPGGGVSSSSYAIVEVHTPTETIAVGPPHLSEVGYPLVFSDFNNDGILDFASTWGSKIRIRLGNGNGTFGVSKVATFSYDSNDLAAIVTGDFNNDGNEDLLYGANPNPPPYYLRTTLGLGDGTFRKGSRFGISFYANGLAAADFNRDGNLDVASISNPVDLNIFLGQGDGSFRHRALYRQFRSSTSDISIADFNGDGIPDLVIPAGGVYVLLGRGDGTFDKPRRVIANDRAGTCTGTPQLVVSDFNGDGKTDLAYCERHYGNGGKIWVALGNGDGTFQKPISLTVPANQGVFSFAVGDFNSDGKTDILTNYYLPNTWLKTETDLFLGNGNGTFQRRKIIRLPGQSEYNAENGIVPADLNSDGLLDLIVEQAGPLAIFVQR
ncbi:MAG TPA: VCBS repeat-containing protein [Terriglobales bacterium]|nr:VCBS repeat-containing protein [Terriglobales bacterium]